MARTKGKRKIGRKERSISLVKEIGIREGRGRGRDLGGWVIYGLWIVDWGVADDDQSCLLLGGKGGYFLFEKSWGGMVGVVWCLLTPVMFLCTGAWESENGFFLLWKDVFPEIWSGFGICSGICYAMLRCAMAT
ncbi:hypothetical protein L873DRAFT_969401 [Choiromyces venosus 120613-1]|uniref:Uncharacterized protein n=1 Tax=Choiromyces venosus 120613-1 TaxID=1336337 RepID=A0A3N4JLA2_9PEZI|nr:hypothetical protein L873DRAFT_969401 [Choiromyces venosus 120613-1]